MDIENSSLDFLESIEDQPAKKSADTRLLKKAADYSINLEEMEKITTKEKTDTAKKENTDIRFIPQEDEYSTADIETKSGFEKIDIHLQDVVTKVFHNSDRPIIIIRDDKIIYTNAIFLKLVGLNNDNKALNRNFLEFVVKDYWNIVAENIGEALTTGKSMQIGIKDTKGTIQKISFDAIYIPDNRNFSFILVGQRLSIVEATMQNLLDGVTGLPSYYLLQDRIQLITVSKNNLELTFGKDMTALIGISIDNMANFERIGNSDLIMKRLTSRLGLTLNKQYTLARGLKYHFWILIPNIADMGILETEVEKVKSLLDEPIEDNFSRYEIISSVGVSTFPEPSTSGKKLLEQTMLAIEKAQKIGNGKPVYFGA